MVYEHSRGINLFSLIFFGDTSMNTGNSKLEILQDTALRHRSAGTSQCSCFCFLEKRFKGELLISCAKTFCCDKLG